MAYEFEPKKMYHMPTHFGPQTGPRQGPDGRKFENKDTPKTTAFAVSFLTNPNKLEALLPKNFELTSEPVVTINCQYLTEIEWLAGRGYNIVSISFPAAFRGKKDHVIGKFVPVLWENLADPIITGREQLGFPKIYCEIPEPITLGNKSHIIAHWQGFKWLDVNISATHQKSKEEYSAEQGIGDLLFYKYIPKTGDWGKSESEYACHLPSHCPNRIIKEQSTGEGTVKFHRARWEDMPTQYNIVNTLSDLEILEYRDASITKTEGMKDLSDQRVLI